MSKRLTHPLFRKRSWLPLAPLASLTLGGCGMLEMANPLRHTDPATPPAPARPVVATPPAPDPPTGDTAALAYADRLAKAEKVYQQALKGSAGPIVLASDQHLAGQPGAVTPADADHAAGLKMPPPDNEHVTVTVGPVKSADSPNPVVPITTVPFTIVPPTPTPAATIPPAVVAPTTVSPTAPPTAVPPAMDKTPSTPAPSPAAVAAPTPTGAVAMASVSAEHGQSGAGLSAMGIMNASANAPMGPSVGANGSSLSNLPAGIGNTEPTMDSVLDLLRKRVQAKPQQLNYALALALLNSAEMHKPGDPALTGLNAMDQSLVSDMTHAIESISAQPVTPTDTLSQRAAPLLAASQKWQVDADLKLPRLMLASRVDSFGVYTPVTPRFEYGRRQTVIIYCEVANFASKHNDEGLYQTLLTQQDTLTTDDGLLIWRPNPEDVEDRSLNQRRDFYLVKKLTLPETLAIGKYTLKMSVTDKLAKKRAEVTMPIEIVGR